MCSSARLALPIIAYGADDATPKQGIPGRFVAQCRGDERMPILQEMDEELTRR
jgi:hypothetical protein